GIDRNHGSGRHWSIPDTSAGNDRHGSTGFSAENYKGNSQAEQSARTPLLDAARSSYYGGWFEIFAHGHIPEVTWEYDINSAYPAIISRLPCLSHGRWEYGRDIDTRP